MRRMQWIRGAELVIEGMNGDGYTGDQIRVLDICMDLWIYV